MNTYQDSDAFVDAGNLEHAHLQFLNHSLLYISAFLGLLSHTANFLGPIPVIGIQARVVLRQLPKGFPRRRLNLERLEFLECMALVHPLNDGVHVS